MSLSPTAEAPASETRTPTRRSSHRSQTPKTVLNPPSPTQNAAYPASASPRLAAISSSRPTSPARSILANEGLFERDVEWFSDHALNAQEASDIAIPPVLQEAATVLTSDDVAPEEIESLIRVASSSKLAGWQSPMSDSFCSDISGYQSPVPSLPRGPTSREGAFYIPRAISPSYSSSPPESSVLTPSTSPSPPPRDLYSSTVGHIKTTSPPPISFIRDLRSGSSSPRDAGSPISLSPVRSTGFSLEPPIRAYSLPPSPQMDSFPEEELTRKTRRLSFFSYADLINSERSDHSESQSPVPLETPRPTTSIEANLWKAFADAEDQPSLSSTIQRGRTGREP